MAAYDDEDDTVTAPDASSETAPNGITRMVLNNAGQVTEAMLYSAYGTMSYMGSTPAGTENTKEKFTGKELDKDGAYGSITAGIGAYCLGVRMYDPEIAMFMACDPKSQYWSPYSYCGDNPLRLVDQSGKNSKDPQDSTQDSTQLDSLEYGNKVSVSEDEEKELRKQAREYAYLGGELTEDQIFELLRNRKLKEKAGKAKEGEGEASGSGTRYSLAGVRTPSSGAPGSFNEFPDGSGGKTVRYFGPDGKAIRDVDFGHNHGAGDPHEHPWNWSQKSPRQPGRPIVEPTAPRPTFWPAAGATMLRLGGAVLLLLFLSDTPPNSTTGGN